MQQCVVVFGVDFSLLRCVAVRCSVLQCAAVCCSVLQCLAVWCNMLQCVAVKFEDFSAACVSLSTTRPVRNMLLMSVCCSVL